MYTLLPHRLHLRRNDQDVNLALKAATLSDILESQHLSNVTAGSGSASDYTVTVLLT